MTSPSMLPYRSCVGIMLVNPQGRIFLGCRYDIPDAWQMPQGGVEPGESIADAALREMEEEIGTAKAKILAETGDWLRYDFPDYAVGKIYNGQYRGQQQKWVLAQFVGEDSDINLNTKEREFVAWKWVLPSMLLTTVVHFKRPVYQAVLKEFLPLISKIQKPV